MCGLQHQAYRRVRARPCIAGPSCHIRDDSMKATSSHIKRTAVYCIFLGTRRHGCNLMLLRGPKLSRNPVHSCFLHLLSRRLALPGPGLRQRRPWLKPSQLSQSPGGALCGPCFRHPCVPKCSWRIPSMTGGMACSTDEDPLGYESRLLPLCDIASLSGVNMLLCIKFNH